MDEIPEPLSNIGCQEMLSEEYTHSGWVRKKAFINKLGAIRWPQVYMVLANGCIYYFNNDYSKAPHGKFSLYGYNSVKRDKEVSIKQAPFPFKIEHSNPDFKTYIFAASSEKEMKEWMKFIKGQMVSANGQTAENYYYTYRKAGKVIKQAEIDDKSLTYQEIETDIYASGAFKPSKDYSAKFKVKLKDEDSDDEELQRVPAPPPRKPIDPRDRPPQPIPTDVGPPTYAAPKVPARQKEATPETKEDDDKPEIKPRTYKSDSSTQKHLRQPLDELQAELKASMVETDKQEKRGKRRHKKHRDHQGTEGQGDRKHGHHRTIGDDDEDDDPYVSMKLRNGVQQEAEVEEEGGVGEDENDERAYWDAIYFREDDKEKANEIIRNIGEEGVFLVRPGESNSQVLVVFADNYPKKFRIQEKNNEYFLASEGPHEHTLEMLLYVYHTQDLPTAKVMLNTPYKLHEKYKKLP